MRFFFPTDGNRGRERDTLQDGVDVLCGARSNSQNQSFLSPTIWDSSCCRLMWGHLLPCLIIQKIRMPLANIATFGTWVFHWKPKIYVTNSCVSFSDIMRGRISRLLGSWLLKARPCSVWGKEANWKEAELYLFSISKYLTFGQSEIWLNTPPHTCSLVQSQYIYLSHFQFVFLLLQSYFI